MESTKLPNTVVRAWGAEAAQDFVAWLEERMQAVPPQVQVSALVARQKVNVLMLEQVSNLLLAGEPALEQTSEGNWLWRVPVDLTFPARGRVGRVGEVLVDARYGQVRYDDALLARITKEAEQLARQEVSLAQPAW
jgi:hypothetical protein